MKRELSLGTGVIPGSAGLPAFYSKGFEFAFTNDVVFMLRRI